MTVITAERRGSDFAQLSRRVTGAGLMNRRPGRYALTIAAVIALYVGAWIAFVAVGASWWTLAVAALLAVATTPGTVRCSAAAGRATSPA